MPNRLTGLFRSRDKPRNAASQALAFFFGSAMSGQSVSPRSAMQITTVYACVRVISETIASLPLHVYGYTDTGKEKALDHPLYRILHDEPNAEMTSFLWRETMLAHLLLWGNSYSQIIRDGHGQVLSLYPLLPENMAVDRDDSGRLTFVYSKDGTEYPLRAEDVLHIPGLGFDGIVGYSPIALTKNALGLGMAVEEFGSKYFANGATPSGVLTHPNTVKDVKKLRESWQSAYGGTGNSHKTAILEEGMKFEKISMPNNESQFLETRKFQVSEVCRIFRVPPHMVAELEHATFSNIEHESINFGVYTIRPWLVRIEQSLNRALLSEDEKGAFFAQFNIDGLLRGAYKERMEGYAIARQNGWMNANDIRELENMNPIPEEEGGNIYYINSAMMPLNIKRSAEGNNGSTVNT